MSSVFECSAPEQSNLKLGISRAYRNPMISILAVLMYFFFCFRCSSSWLHSPFNSKRTQNENGPRNCQNTVLVELMKVSRSEAGLTQHQQQAQQPTAEQGAEHSPPVASRPSSAMGGAGIFARVQPDTGNRVGGRRQHSGTFISSRLL